ncbi:MAG: hypothetical protein J7604_03530 [Sporocytophaga sp.]|uniref:hypothetical protein n=1 Tax=Sporocytophaga sp. TaxID=2231183 RepID=UPI001B2A7367|nr:hypothetical protein [Sporocytophaga sp.]MBO9699252.1 hypothetical protein [Sporocytophaga sp.]
MERAYKIANLEVAFDDTGDLLTKLEETKASRLKKLGANADLKRLDEKLLKLTSLRNEIEKLIESYYKGPVLNASPELKFHLNMIYKPNIYNGDKYWYDKV